MKDPAVVGIDLGGTNVRLALVSPQGKILSRWERATASMPDQAALVSTLAADLAIAGEAARSQGWEIKGVGIGVPGLIRPQEGLVVFSPNVPALNECPLVPLLAPQVNWPLFLENDANLFALGEHWLGAGVGQQHMLGITLGTGVGGGLILNGQVWAGTEGTAGEIGHMTVDPEGRKCHCGNRGCLETLASASWTVTWVKEQLAQGASSWLRELYEADPDAIEGQTLVVAAQQADPLARRAFDRVGRSLGLVIARRGPPPGNFPGGHRRPLCPGLGGVPVPPGGRTAPAPHPVSPGGGERLPGPTGRRRRPGGRRPPGLAGGGRKVTDSRCHKFIPLADS